MGLIRSHGRLGWMQRSGCVMRRRAGGFARCWRTLGGRFRGGNLGSLAIYFVCGYVCVSPQSFGRVESICIAFRSWLSGLQCQARRLHYHWWTWRRSFGHVSVVEDMAKNESQDHRCLTATSLPMRGARDYRVTSSVMRDITRPLRLINYQLHMPQADGCLHDDMNPRQDE